MDIGRGGVEGVAFGRRHALSNTSARSLLLTVLGELVLPYGEPVWTSAFVEVLGRLGVEEKSARQALTRGASEGWLAAERIGRRARWSLTPSGRRLLSEGAERIYSFQAAQQSWDGRWLLLVVSVAESARRRRHQLRTRLRWAGFGSPAPRLWVSPQASREAEAREIVEELGLAGTAMSFIAGFADIGEQRTIVDQAWDLGDLSARYEDFIVEFAGQAPEAGDAVLLAQIRLVHAWRRFPFLDPGLPTRLLPPGWSGSRASDLFHDKHKAWHDGAQARWAEITRGGRR
ncbi:MAG: PaaX family transcriptional regulator [Streptosporangiaceae bacterium]